MSAPSSKPDYGLDAPGLVKGFGLSTLVLLALGIVSRIVEVPWPAGLTRWTVWPAGSLGLTVLLMLWSSYVGKQRARDRLLDGLRLAGTETVLDVGCGRGLLLIGAAKRLGKGGRAIGVDIWSATDLSANSRDATLHNADVEGVRARVEVVDSDMRKMKVESESVDVVVSSFAIHNVPTRDGRSEAMAEIARVLRPSGKVALQDFQHVGEYAEDLAAAGLVSISVGGLSLWTFPPSRIVHARKRDAAVAKAA